MIDTTTTLDIKDVDAESFFAAIVTQLSDLQWNPDMTGPQAFGAMKQVLLLRNLVDHHATTLTGEMDRLGVADHKTTRLRELLISMGFAPAVAGRYVRMAGTTDIDLLLAHAADGSISSEHTDAIVRGLAHIDTRSPEPLDTVQRCELLRKLLSHYFAGFTPAEINLYARQLGNELAAETPGGLPAAEDKNINSYTDRITDDGRLEISANLALLGTSTIGMGRPSGTKPGVGTPPRWSRCEPRAASLETDCTGAGFGPRWPGTRVQITVRRSDSRNR